MKTAGDRLHILAGVLGLAFGIYCLAVAFCSAALGLANLGFIVLVACIIIGCLYIIYGILALISSHGGMGTIMVFGIFAGACWWSSGMPWFLWPMVIMPLVILGLTLVILVRMLRGMSDR